MLERPILELATALLTGAAALTLIPHRRNLIGSTVESGVWVAFVLASGLCIATFGGPKLQEATASIAWGALELVKIQVAFVMGLAGAWTGAHRFMIANWIALAAGVDLLALAFIRSARAARQSEARVHLGEWFELPRPVARPVVLPVPDPLAAIDRRLAGAAHTEFQLIKGKVQTSPALARAAVGTAHLLGPGHLRLHMVKLALSIKSRRAVLTDAAATTASPMRLQNPNGHRGARPRKAAATGGVVSVQGRSPERRGAADRPQKKQTSSAPAFRNRMAS